MSPTVPKRVLIAGGGVAGLEALLALRELAGDRVRLTLLSDRDDFAYRPMAVAEPFARGRSTRRPLTEITAAAGAELVRGRLVAVDGPMRTAITAAGERLAYDALLVAVGAQAEPVLRGALTWTPEADADLFGGLLRDLEEGYSKRVAFVVPPGVAWTLPAYELALMTAWQVWDMGQDDVEVTVYTPEPAPLVLFGAHAAAAVQRDLDEVGIRVQTGVRVVDDPGGGGLVLDPGRRPLAAERAVALPAAVGPGVAGLPCNPDGFVTTDRHGRVPELDGVWAAGDAIAFAIKQGGIAAQQADAAAESIAAAAGAELEPRPFVPLLRGVMLTGRGRRWLRHDPGGDDPEGTTARRALWWPPTKIAGRYLAPYLADLDGAEPVDRAAPSGQPVELELLATADALRELIAVQDGAAR